MAGTVDVRVAARLGRIADVHEIDGDAAALLLRRRVDLVVRHICGLVLLGQHFGDGRSQRRLAVIDMTY